MSSQNNMPHSGQGQDLAQRKTEEAETHTHNTDTMSVLGPVIQLIFETK